MCGLLPENSGCPPSRFPFPPLSSCSLFLAPGLFPHPLPRGETEVFLERILKPQGPIGLLLKVLVVVAPSAGCHLHSVPPGSAGSSPEGCPPFLESPPPCGP